jgi:hypothetical protein
VAFADWRDTLSPGWRVMIDSAGMPIIKSVCIAQNLLVVAIFP